MKNISPTYPNFLTSLFIFSFLLLCFLVKASVKEQDSLKDLYNLGIEIYEKGEINSSMVILKKAESLSQRSEDKETIVELNKKLGQIFYDSQRFDSAFVYFQNTVRLKKEFGIKDELVGDYIRLGFTCLEKGISDTALIYMDTARLYQEATNKTSTSLENNSGRIYLDKGDFEKALECFLIALENAQTEQDTINLIYINVNLGTLFQRMNKFDKALDYYLRSYEISKLFNSLEGMATAYSIGIIYKNKGEYDKAMEYYLQAIPICEKLNKYQDLTNIYSNMSNVYMLKEEYNKAEEMLRMSIKISSQKDFNRHLGIAYANMGKTKELMGQVDSAVFYLKKSIMVVEKLGSPNLLSAVYSLTSDAYEKGSDFENAFIFYRKHIDLKDSIFSEKVEKQIAELQTKYETEKTEKENSLLKQEIDFEKRKSNYLFFISVGLSLMGIVSLALFYFIRKNALTKKQLAESEAARLENELDSQKRELTLGALSLSRNLEFINSLIVELKDLYSHVSTDGMTSLRNIVKKLSKQQSNTSWKEFEKRFSEIHSEFYTQLLDAYPDLSRNEVKLSAFLKLGMNTKEICSLTFQSVRAVEATRLRLRKKLKLTNGENLSMFLQKY